MLFGTEPERVEASMLRDPDLEIDVLTSALLVFPGGGTGTFTVSTRSESDQRVHVYGTDGRISIDIPFNIPPDRPTRIHVTHGGDPPVAPNTETMTFPTADPYTAETEAFAAAILDGTPTPTPPADGVANLRVIEAVFAAAEGRGADGVPASPAGAATGA
jgi:predicted dehydrogenase